MVDGVKGTGVFKNFSLGSFATATTDAAAGQPTEVDQLVESNDVVLFVSSGCPFCSMADSALKAASIEHTVVERTPEIAAALFAKTGKTSVPSTWVKGSYVGGCNDGPEPGFGVIPLLKSGKLQEMLA